MFPILHANSSPSKQKILLLCIPALLFLGLATLTAESPGNLIRNAGFEKKAAGKSSSWQKILADQWTILLNTGEKNCSATLCSPGRTGNQGILIRSLTSKDCCTSIRQDSRFPVRPGQLVEASAYIKGKGTGYVRLYYYDRDGRKMNQYQMRGLKAGKDWQKITLRFKIPDHVHSLLYALETIRGETEIIFDDAFLTIRAGTVLSNQSLYVKLNPEVGGGIDSLVLKKKNFELSHPNTPGRMGGVAMTLIPDKGGPFRNDPYKPEILLPEKKIRLVSYSSPPGLDGLRITKEYELPDEDPVLNINILLENTGRKPMKVSHRMQNCISCESGIYSLPTPDWLQIAEQQVDPLKGYQVIANNLLRAGWSAKFFRNSKITALFEFNLNDIDKTYSWNSTDISTLEWYYRPQTIPPGGTWQTRCRISLADNQKNFYADAFGSRQSVHTVRSIPLPAPPQQESLPPQFHDFFPFAGDLCGLLEPELAGSESPMSYEKMFAANALRLTRIFADSYFNSIYSVRLIYGHMHAPFQNPDGSHQLGEMLRDYDLQCLLENILVAKNDTSPEEYIRKKWPVFKKQLSHPELRKFINSYQDRMPLFFTGDELRPDNLTTMLRMNAELKKILPGHIIAFPYLNSSTVQFIPYVPVFLGDFYPIKRAGHSGRRPWTIYEEFLSKVRLAGKTRVWFMPQGFGTDDIYGLPTAGEVRLMLSLAVAAGVKGICWHGLANGTCPWMQNYPWYRYSLLGGAGQRAPGWEGVVDCARDIATIGALAVRSSPGKVPADISLQCRQYKAASGFYDGPAVKCFALKTPEGILLSVINQNPDSTEQAVVRGLPGQVFDLSSFTRLAQPSVTLQLKPGGAHYFYLGQSRNEIDLCCRERFKREKTRYRIQAETASANGIRVESAENLDRLPPLQALQEILQKQKDLTTLCNQSELGIQLKQIQNAWKMIDHLDFLLAVNLSLLAPPEMKKETPMHSRWKPHPIKEIEDMKQSIFHDFAEFYRLSDALVKGSTKHSLAADINKMHQRLTKDYHNTLALLKRYQTKFPPDQP